MAMDKAYLFLFMWPELFVGSKDEVGQTVSVRSESMHLLLSELINATVTCG